MTHYPETSWNWKNQALAFLLEAGTHQQFTRQESLRSHAILKFHERAGCDDIYLIQKLDNVAETIITTTQPSLQGIFTETYFLHPTIEEDQLYHYHETVQPPNRSHFLNDVSSVLYISLSEADFQGSIILTWKKPFTLPEGFHDFLRVCIDRIREIIRLDFTFHSLEELRVKFMAVFNSVSNAIVFMDDRGRDPWLNPEAIELLNLTHSADLTPAAIAASMRTLRERASNADEIILQASEYFKKPERPFSQWLWKYDDRVLQVSSTPVTSESINGRLWMFENISEIYFANQKLQWLNAEVHKANEEIKRSLQNLSDKNALIEQQNRAIRQQNEKLESINQEKDNLIGIVSHDLRSPLQQVSGLTDILLMDADKLNDDQKFIIQRIQHSLERGLNLIKDLLEVSTLEQNRPVQKTIPLDLAQLLRDELTVYKELGRKKNIQVVFTNEAVHAVINGDLDFIRRILDNLVSNAIKFSNTGTSVYITLQNRQEHLIITVRDEGQGITEADKKNLFQKFGKLTARPTGNETSTGLGLYIVKTLVENSGGDITCESEWEKGTSFIIRFPVQVI
ncbi:MAG TPA: HAMP domain-containing sensor histidine kinase [Ohtaekwangia sp.]|uniref:sensor histidine kinase n=1 Tax=Ohtaekwangia sp. TaxID=2066019 RepID=UPI002F936F52